MLYKVPFIYFFKGLKGQPRLVMSMACSKPQLLQAGRELTAYAAVTGHAATARFLLEAGANKDFRLGGCP